MEDIYYNRITELLKDHVNLSNIEPVAHNAIDWRVLSNNSNAISILERNVDKIHWGWLSLNPNAISILEENMDKIKWTALS